MKVLSWNCRGLGVPSTISQHKKSIRNHLPDIIFLCETKKTDQFIQTVCRKLIFQTRWASTEPVGLSRGLLLCWSEDTIIHQLIKSKFGFEVEFETPTSHGKCWGVLLYLNPNLKERREQWIYLHLNHDKWGKKWFLRGDLNDIRRPEEKRGGRRRTAGSCQQFRDFIATMDMEEINFKGRTWTWVNNRAIEGFVEERLNRFFASLDWLLEFANATVLYEEKQSSDHSLLVLEFNPQRSVHKKKILF